MKALIKGGDFSVVKYLRQQKFFTNLLVEKTFLQFYAE